MLLKKYKLNNNLNYYFHHTKKYKSFCIKIYFLLPYEKEKITIRNLLKDVLIYDSKNYSNVEIIDKKRELYNLKVSINSNPLNSHHQYCLTISGTNPKYFLDEDYDLNKIFDYVNEIIFNPNIEQDTFNNNSYETCLNRYKIALKTALEDKNVMAIYESMDLMEEDENKYCQFGYLSDFDKITNKELYNEYQKLLNSKIIISCIGDLDNKVLKRNLKKLFNNFNEFKDIIKMTPSKYQDYKEKEIKIKTEQAIVVMNFATEIEKFQQEYFDLLVFNMLFGGESNSKLFQIIREEYGFCYEIYSNLEASNGVITVYMGLDEENIDKAKSLVLEQIEKIKKGHFKISEMNQFIRNEYTRVQNTYDNIQSTLSREITLNIFNRDTALKTLKDNLSRVNKESIMNVANKVKLINTLIIKSKGEQ